MKTTLIIGALAVAALAGCASGPYYDSYGYGPGYDPYYYGDAYGYGAPTYWGPSVGFGYYYYDNDGHRHWRDGDRWRDGNRWRDGGRHWEGGNVDRGSRSRGGESAFGDVRSYHGEMGNEAGAGRPVQQ